MLSLTVLPGLC